MTELSELRPAMLGGIVTASISACGASLILTPLVRLLARRVGAFAKAGERHLHSGQVPTLGGLAIAAATAIALIVPWFDAPATIALLISYQWNLGWLAFAGLIILAVGVVDDVRDISAGWKLLWQTIAATALLAGGYGFAAVTNPLTGGVFELGWFGPLASVVWTVGIINAFNLIDGLDGLATGVGVVACITIALVGVVEGRPDAVVFAAVLGGALVGFLVFNFHPASIFLGDSGSMMIGFLLALLSLAGLQKGTTTVVVLVPVLTLGLPIVETAVSVVRRYLVAGWAAVFRADREHIHHRLLAMGLNHRRAVLTLYAVAVFFGIAAFLSVFARGAQNALLIGVVAAVTYLGIRKLGYRSGTAHASAEADEPGS